MRPGPFVLNGATLCIVRPTVEASPGSGYNSSSRFQEQSDKLLGMALTDYKQGGAGLSIQSSTAQGGWVSVPCFQRCEAPLNPMNSYRPELR